jgi:hypothetical protein
MRSREMNLTEPLPGCMYLQRGPFSTNSYGKYLPSERRAKNYNDDDSHGESHDCQAGDANDRLGAKVFTMTSCTRLATPVLNFSSR